MAKKFPKHRILLPNVRLSYAYLGSPRQPDDADKSPSYGAQLLIPNGGAAHKLMQQTINKIFMEVAGGDKAKAQKIAKNPNVKKGLRNPEHEEDREGAEYEGMMFCNANCKASYGRPGVILKNGTKLIDPEEIEQHVYSGCWANVSVSLQWYNQDGGKGVAIYLNNVMKEKDGDRLDGGVDATDEFADMIDEDADVGVGLGAGSDLNDDDIFGDGGDDLLGGDDDDDDWDL